MNIFHAFGGDLDYVTTVEASEAKSAARGAKTAVTTVEHRLERAMLACEAMWSLMREKLGVTDLELLDRINAMDLSDGKLDGRVTKPAVTCPSCHRTIARRQAKCMYCGQQVMYDPFA
jgi:hypothetical protein